MAKDSNRGSTYQGASSSEGEGGGSTLRDGMDRIKDEAARGGAAAIDTLKQSAQALGDQARERVEGYAEGGKEVVRQHLDDFASAVRKASDELSEHDQTLASQLVRQAAGGLESLSRSVNNTSFGDLVDSVRDFGRRNPAAFIGGAVLAGLALGRFVRASSRDRAWDDGDDDWRGGRGSYQRRDANGRFVPRSDWESGRGGNEGITPRPYSGGMASQGTASGGSRAYSSGPSSGADASLGTSVRGSGIGSGSISTGDGS